MTKLYGILDKQNNTLYRDYIRVSDDLREVKEIFSRMVNDVDRGGLLYSNTEDFTLICVADIYGDHLEHPKVDGKEVNYYKVFDLVDLKEQG